KRLKIMERKFLRLSLRVSKGLVVSAKHPFHSCSLFVCYVTNMERCLSPIPYSAVTVVREIFTRTTMLVYRRISTRWRKAWATAFLLAQSVFRQNLRHRMVC